MYYSIMKEVLLLSFCLVLALTSQRVWSFRHDALGTYDPSFLPQDDDVQATEKPPTIEGETASLPQQEAMTAFEDEKEEDIIEVKYDKLLLRTNLLNRCVKEAIRRLVATRFINSDDGSSLTD